jgi:hypothetical protein
MSGLLDGLRLGYRRNKHQFVRFPWVDFFANVIRTLSEAHEHTSCWLLAAGALIWGDPVITCKLLPV